MSGDIQYPDHFIERLHTIWGEGFLSPGGAEEVGEILTGLDLHGSTVLDVGFGTGGPAMTLARVHGAAQVTGIDVEPQLHDIAGKLIDQAGLSEQIDLHLVEPGPFQFADNTFDVVFSKDSMIHIEDKQELFAEIIRVLKPGGVFVASDWLAGTGEAAEAALETFTEVVHLNFAMATAAQMESILRDAGFAEVSTRDRNAWYAQVSAHELEQVEGPLRAQLIDAVGEEIYLDWLKVRQGLAAATAAGGLRPTHLRGFKPPDSSVSL